MLIVLKTKYLLSPISYEGIHRREKLEYPVEALREALLNAIIHRDYMNTSDIQIKIFDSAIQFYNPGGLYGNISIKDLLSNNYRLQLVIVNRILAELVLKMHILPPDLIRMITGGTMILANPQLIILFRISPEITALSVHFVFL
jgi:predicted HTH transcriptional regulator